MFSGVLWGGASRLRVGRKGCSDVLLPSAPTPKQEGDACEPGTCQCLDNLSTGEMFNGHRPLADALQYDST